MCKKKLTIILGAGAALDVGGFSTKEITKLICNTKQDGLNSKDELYSILFIKSIYDELTSYYSPYEPNFEDLLHAIEVLQTYQTILKNPTAHSKIKPILFPFIDKFKDHYYDFTLLNSAIKSLFVTITDKVHDYSSNYLNNIDKYKWHYNFWTDLSKKFQCNIVNLNYDNIIEASFKDYNDGFNPKNNPSRFAPLDLLKNKGHKIMHLHGSYLFGYPDVKSYNANSLEETSDSLWKYQSYDEAKNSLHFHSTNSLQSREQIAHGPIVTGLRKSEKILSYPLSLYHHILNQSIYKCKNLLIIGYSFNDLYINSLIFNFARIHGNNRKIIVIDNFPFPIESWCPKPWGNKWPNENMYSFIVRTFKEEQPFKNYKFQDLVYSKDGNAGVYFLGFNKFYNNKMNILNTFFK